MMNWSSIDQRSINGRSTEFQWQLSSEATRASLSDLTDERQGH
jgi:hypothetical protein